MGFKDSESNSSEEIKSNNNNYIYDGYGFLLVNSVEDLLYDKFNDCMDNYINIQQDKNNKKKESIKNINEFNNKYENNISKIKKGIYVNYNNNISKFKNNHGNKGSSLIIGLTKDKNNFIKNNKNQDNFEKNSYKENEISKQVKNYKQDNPNSNLNYYKKNDSMDTKNDKSKISVINKNNNKNDTDQINFNNNSNKNKSQYIKNIYNDIIDNYKIEKNNFQLGNINTKNENNNFLIKSSIKNLHTNIKYEYTRDKKEEIVNDDTSISFQQRFNVENNTENKNNTKYDQEEAFTFGGEKNEGDLNINLNSNNINFDTNDEKIITFNNLSKSIDSKNHLRTKKNYDKDDDIAYKLEENKTKKINQKKNTKENNIKRNVDDLEIIDNKKRNKVIKKNKKNSLNKPHISACYITKIRKDNNFIIRFQKIIPKKKRVFISKKYSTIKKKSNRKNKKLLVPPKSTICYFQKNNKIINIKTHSIFQTVVNAHFFVTKELIKNKKENNIHIINKKVIEKNTTRLKTNNMSTNISVKLENHKKQSFLFNKNDKNNLQTSRYEISCSDINKKNNSNQVIYPPIEKKEKLNESKYEKNIGCIIKNHMIREALNKSNKKKKSIKIIKLKPKPEKQIFSQTNTEKKLSKEYKIPIKNKFKNNMMNNYKMFDLLRNNGKNTIFPIKRKIYSEKNKNKSMSYIKEQNYENYLFFPAIDSYFN